MDIVCLDMEGVLVPEIWINVALRTGIEELKITTREEPDYDKLMTNRSGSEEHNLRLSDIEDVIGGMGRLKVPMTFFIAQVDDAGGHSVTPSPSSPSL